LADMKKLVFLLALTAISVAAFAQNPVGTWKGKIQIDKSALAGVQDPKQKEMALKMLSQVEAMTLSLNVKANKTFVVNIPSMAGQPAQSSEGTWTQKGNQVTLVTTKRQGKAVTNDKPKSMTLAPGGKKMVMVANEGPQKATITFTR
jgi:hypothetical protein